MSLHEAANVLKARLHGSDAVFTGVDTDTRRLRPGDLFFALKGPRFDGHLFLGEAAAAGAVGAVVSREIEAPLSTVEVADTRVALGELAAHWRARFEFPVIAVTGSNGKTTVKNMIASIMAQTGPGSATEGNLNNDIGVPLTLLKLKPEHRYAVVEMGMNHRGEIAYLTNLARPTVAVITNAGAAHLEGLGSVEAVARAKGEIFAGLARDGIAVINADDEYAGLWRELAAPRRCITFGLENKADVSAQYQSLADGSTIQLTTEMGEVEMKLPLLGRHNVMNAVAAASASLAGGASLADIRQGLEKLKAVAGRLEIKQGINGARILDDTYNANPASVAAGLQVLREASGERVLVLGDMAELGEAAEEIHRRVGEMARRVGVERLLTVGTLSAAAAEAFGKGAKHFASHEECADALLDLLHGEVTVLIKGSRSMHMEDVVRRVVQADQG
jgi:UDP-N-acetylmuramoyl-tripeptide--D-alanyl-D-alanine ligase